MRLWRLAAPGLLVMLASGCHSAFIDAVVINKTGQPVSLVEVDYPSASFGTQTLNPGQEYKYRFKVLGSGDLKLLWTDAQRKDHTVAGPTLNEGAEGSLAISIKPDGVDWAPKFKKAS